MATNTGIRKCKNKSCGREFVKRHSLDAYCSYDCAAKSKPKTITVKKKEVRKEVEKIASVSERNKCRCSDGTSMSATELMRRIRKAKQEKIEAMENAFGYVFCEDCKEFGIPEGANEMELKIIDCSHEISVDEAKKSGRCELACDVNNIRMRCRVHHRKHDKTE